MRVERATFGMPSQLTACAATQGIIPAETNFEAGLGAAETGLEADKAGLDGTATGLEASKTCQVSRPDQRYQILCNTGCRTSTLYY